MKVHNKYYPFKRFFDIVFSAILLIVLSPLLLATAILIKLESRGPVIFSQQRVGFKGKPFKIFKFRSMVTGAAQMGSGVYSYQNDPRITRVGRFIRKTSIDELPQFFNILIGDMSFIGPRPPLLTHPFPFDKYPEAAKHRFDVLPGITGLAQVNGRKEISWDKRFEYDLEYVRTMSLVNDLKIVWKTILKVLFMADNVNVGKTA